MMNFRNEPVTIKLLGKHVRKVHGKVVIKDKDIQKKIQSIPVYVLDIKLNI